VNYIVQKSASSTRERRDIACIVGIWFVAVQTTKSNYEGPVKGPVRFAGTATVAPSVLPGGDPNLLCTGHPVSPKHNHRFVTRRSQ